MKLRLRAHGEEIVREALARWESVDTDADDLCRGRERSPLDARIWLSPWPLSIVQRQIEKRSATHIAPFGDPLAPNDAPVIVALARLHRIDPSGFAMLVERIRGLFDPLVWRSALGDHDATLEERMTLALYRFLVLRTDALGKIEDARARVCLAARRFRAGDRSEFASLRAAREELADTSLTVAKLRSLETEGAKRSLELLATDPIYSVILGDQALSLLRRALRMDTGASDPVPDFEVLDPVFAVIEREVDECHARTADGHAPTLDLAWFAAGEAPRDRALSHVEHLLVCSDRRCVDLLRGEVSGRDALARALSGPMSDPPPAMPLRSAGLPLFERSAAGPNASPRMIRCRDVLWETFASMAQDEGRDVDDLVEEAMDRYRLLRERVREASSTELVPEPAPTRPRSSRPPPSGRTGLRLGSQSWPPHRGDSEPTPTDEPTLLTPGDEITKKRPS